MFDFFAAGEGVVGLDETAAFGLQPGEAVLEGLIEGFGLRFLSAGRLHGLPVTADVGHFLLAASFFLEKMTGNTEGEGWEVVDVVVEGGIGGAFSEAVDGLVGESGWVLDVVPVEKAGEAKMELVILDGGLRLVGVQQGEKLLEHFFVHRPSVAWGILARAKWCRWCFVPLVG